MWETSILYPYPNQKKMLHPTSPLSRAADFTLGRLNVLMMGVAVVGCMGGRVRSRGVIEKGLAVDEETGETGARVSVLMEKKGRGVLVTKSWSKWVLKHKRPHKTAIRLTTGYWSEHMN